MWPDLRRRTLRGAALIAFALAAACTSDPPAGSTTPDIPRGYTATLQLLVEGRLLGFGPFVGYYFRPLDPADLSRLAFICFNERQFYTADLPDGARLFTGEAVRADLPPVDPPPMQEQGRIRPVFDRDIPAAWLDTRPAPQDEFVHFHSCYDGVGPVSTGYWLRHVAAAAFTYDMGGRLGADSILYHKVSPGPDRHFPRIVEFDAGPDH